MSEMLNLFSTQNNFTEKKALNTIKKKHVITYFKWSPSSSKRKKKKYLQLGIDAVANRNRQGSHLRLLPLWVKCVLLDGRHVTCAFITQ